MELNENSLALSQLHKRITSEAILGAYQYQLAMTPSSDVKDMSVLDLLDVASFRYRRRYGVDWFEGSVVHPMP